MNWTVLLSVVFVYLDVDFENSLQLDEEKIVTKLYVFNFFFFLAFGFEFVLEERHTVISGWDVAFF